MQLKNKELLQKDSFINNKWIDVRDVIRTDNNFRDANIDWAVTGAAVARLKKNLVTGGIKYLTQGFVGATDENESTTLGREGREAGWRVPRSHFLHFIVWGGGENPLSVI